MVQPKILSFIITDLKTRRLAGIKKETFEELLKTSGIPARYFCRRSFATWDVLLPTEDLAKKLAGSNISPKYYRLQPEYKGHRKNTSHHVQCPHSIKWRCARCLPQRVRGHRRNYHVEIIKWDCTRRLRRNYVIRSKGVSSHPPNP